MTIETPLNAQARLWYEPHLQRNHEDAEMRRADLLQLEQIASGYPSRERFLTELTLDPMHGVAGIDLKPSPNCNSGIGTATGCRRAYAGDVGAEGSRQFVTSIASLKDKRRSAN
jgi:hypothetical protein